MAVHNVSWSVLVRLIVFTCCEPPRCLQVRCRLTCSNRPPNRFISSRFAVAGARSFVPTISSPEKKTEINIRTHFLPAPQLRKANDFHARAAILGRRGGHLLRAEHVKCIIIIIIIIACDNMTSSYSIANCVIRNILW